jgi:hypothetical protein
LTMGIWDTITDLVEAAAPWSVAEAEAPAEQPEVRQPPARILPFAVVRPSKLPPGQIASWTFAQLSWGVDDSSPPTYIHARLPIWGRAYEANCTLGAAGSDRDQGRGARRGGGCRGRG